MFKYRELHPLLQSTLRIIVSVAIIGASASAVKFLLFPSVQSIIELEDPAAQILARTLGLISVVLPFWAVRQFIEREAAAELRPNFKTSFLFLIVGSLGVGLPIATLYALGMYQIVTFQGLTAIAGVAGLIFVFAISEEIIFRGVIFHHLEKSIGSIWSLVIVSAAFGGLHLTNEGVGPVTVISVSVYGALWTSVYIITRNIWAVGLHHAAWNFVIFATGLPLSGLDRWKEFAPFQSAMQGPLLMTGGDFGPEDSLITVLFSIICIGIILVIAKRKEKFVTPTPK